MTDDLLPPGVRVYAVGDIHGRSDLLDLLLVRIGDDQAADPAPAPVVVFLGDYIDRGMDSAGVIDRLAGEPVPGMAARFVLGNHEEFLLRFLAGESNWYSWLDNGAMTTMESYGVDLQGWPYTFPEPEKARDDLAAAMPAAHRAFFEGLETHVRIGGYFLVHAGVRPGVPLEDQAVHDLLWIREEFLRSDADFGAVVVHGHTPTPRVVSRANRIGVDTGAYASNVLTCVVLEGHKRRFLNT